MHIGSIRVATLITASTIIGLLLAANTAGAQSAGDTFPRLPAAEVQGKQIGWTVNATLDAFVRAVETVKPLVIVFGDVNSGFTRKLTELVLPCPHLNQLAGVAVFAYGAPATDEYARRMASRFKLQTYPTISVIASRTDTLTELYRMEGLFDAERIAGDLQQTLRQNGYWPKDLAAPTALPRHPLAYAGKACNREGAARLGIDVREANPEPRDRR